LQTAFLFGAQLCVPTTVAPQILPGVGRNNNTPVIVGVVVPLGIILLVVLGVVAYVFLIKRRRQQAVRLARFDPEREGL